MKQHGNVLQQTNPHNTSAQKIKFSQRTLNVPNLYDIFRGGQLALKSFNNQSQARIAQTSLPGKRNSMPSIPNYGKANISFNDDNESADKSNAYISTSQEQHQDIDLGCSR